MLLSPVGKHLKLPPGRVPRGPPHSVSTRKPKSSSLRHPPEDKPHPVIHLWVNRQEKQKARGGPPGEVGARSAALGKPNPEKKNGCRTRRTALADLAPPRSGRTPAGAHGQPRGGAPREAQTAPLPRRVLEKKLLGTTTPEGQRGVEGGENPRPSPSPAFWTFLRFNH